MDGTAFLLQERPLKGVKHMDEATARARSALNTWEALATWDIRSGRPISPFVSPHLPTDITRRIQDALTGCHSADEIKIVFASVQEHQCV